MTLQQELNELRGLLDMVNSDLADLWDKEQNLYLDHNRIDLRSCQRNELRDDIAAIERKMKNK